MNEEIQYVVARSNEAASDAGSSCSGCRTCSPARCQRSWRSKGSLACSTMRTAYVFHGVPHDAEGDTSALEGRRALARVASSSAAAELPEQMIREAFEKTGIVA